jgi:suppressor of fused
MNNEDEAVVDDINTQGWDAIDARLALVHGDQNPQHWGSLIKYCLGGPDPLDGISAYRRELPEPHWHYVTYGFSELYEKEGDDPEWSGYGFELTFRLACAPEEESAPLWVLSFLNNLARYVFKTGNTFSPGDHMNLNGPIALDTATRVTGIGIALDPELAEIDSPHGRLRFLQVVGLTSDEYDAALTWNTAGLLELKGRQTALLVTSLTRPSIILDPTLRSELESRSRQEGSKTGMVFNDSARWDMQKRLLRAPRVIVSVGVQAARQSASIIAARIPHGRSFALIAAEHRIEFTPGVVAFKQIDDGRLTLAIPDGLLAELLEVLRADVGDYKLRGIDDLLIRIQPTIIRDAEGKVVTEMR